MTEPAKTPLDALHRSLGGRMVDFAGYAMPVQYPAGILKEHLHTRAAAGLFDVSHMGQIAVRAELGRDRRRRGGARDGWCRSTSLGLAPGRQRYALFTDDERRHPRRPDGRQPRRPPAPRRQRRLQGRRPRAPARRGSARPARVEPLDRALLALQGPKAEAVLATLCPDVAAMRFMDVRAARRRRRRRRRVALRLHRRGRLRDLGPRRGRAPTSPRRCSPSPDVLPVGLGARDSLRLEAGLCLYGHDIDTTTTPVEAALEWAIQPARRARRRPRRRLPRRRGRSSTRSPTARRAAASGCGPRAGRRCARAPSSSPTRRATAVGAITSGGFGPSLDAPVAMGYVPIALAGAGHPALGRLRGKIAACRQWRSALHHPGLQTLNGRRDEC